MIFVKYEVIYYLRCFLSVVPVAFQVTFTYLKSAIETLEKGVTYVQSQQ